MTAGVDLHCITKERMKPNSRKKKNRTARNPNAKAVPDELAKRVKEVEAKIKDESLLAPKGGRNVRQEKKRKKHLEKNAKL